MAHLGAQALRLVNPRAFTLTLRAQSRAMTRGLRSVVLGSSPSREASCISSDRNTYDDPLRRYPRTSPRTTSTPQEPADRRPPHAQNRPGPILTHFRTEAPAPTGRGRDPG